MKEPIIHKATELFLTYGFKSVTMDDIASELGMSKKTIYVHFKNKSVLIKAVAHQLYTIISGGILQIRAEELNPIQELFKVKDFVNEHLKDEKSSPVYQLSKYYPKIHKEMMGKQLQMVEDIILENLDRGISSGVYRKELNKEFILRIYFGGINIIKNDDLFPLTTFSKKEINSMYLEYHLRALVTDKGLLQLNEILKNE